MFQCATDTTEDGHVLDESLVAEDAPPRPPWRELLVSTPGRLILFGAILIAATLVAGVVPSISVGARQQQSRRCAAIPNRWRWRWRRSLSTAHGHRRCGRHHLVHLHRRRSDRAVGDLQSGARGRLGSLDHRRHRGRPAEPECVQQLTDISRHFGVYAGLISTARANGNAGNPIGVAWAMPPR